MSQAGLGALGWDVALDRAFEAWGGTADVSPARVVIEFNYLYRLAGAKGESEAVLAGRFKHRAVSRGELPVVGDWVVVRCRPEEARGAILAVLPRRSWFSRRTAGHTTEEQVVAANVDVLFVVMALDADFSLRRLERYLLLARWSGAAPVVLLTKPDLCLEIDTRVQEVRQAAGDVPVHVVSPKLAQGLDQLTGYLGPGRTGALLGSSGVGKSTIINRLVGHDLLRTGETRARDAKGRHTTTHRELVSLPGGGLLIDTPGMRELQLWETGESAGDTFEEIEALAGTCRFNDCRHRDEPQCAVKAAVADGRIDAARLESYLKLQEELLGLARQREERAQLDERRRGKVMGGVGRHPPKSRRR